MNFSTFVTLDTDDIARRLAQHLDHEELIDFIAAIDDNMSDWEFTEKIYGWALMEHETFVGEVQEHDRRF